MPRNWFTKITRCFYCVDNMSATAQTDPEHDKLHKVHPVLNTVLESCLMHNIPNKHIAVDEQMIGTRCRVNFIQYMPNKPQKFCICCGLWLTVRMGTCVTFRFTQVQRRAQLRLVYPILFYTPSSSLICIKVTNHKRTTIIPLQDSSKIS